MDEERDEIEYEDEEDSGTLMYHIVFKGGVVLRVELPIDEIPVDKEDLVFVRNTSPIAYWTGAILDWNDISACVPDYSNV